VTRGRSQWPTVIAGGVVIAAGFAVALVELMRWPRGSVWIVVAVAVLLLLVVRRVGRR
jgi:UDP-N-acetylmuramyl pentapeptide phosphotransferase/UDP-N-acetylglucosamine-1-phosphate transferase